MIRPRFKLSHKGLILVSVLLALELVFLGAFATLLAQAEREAAEAKRAQAVLDKANVLIKLYYDAATAMAAYTVTKQPVFSKKFDKIINRIPRQMEELRGALKDDPAALATIEPLERSLNNAQNEVAQYKARIDSGEDYDEREVRKQLVPVISDVMARLRELIEAEESITKERNPKQAASLRAKMRDYLLAGIGLNVAIALLLVSFFTKGIVGRLERLADNTVRLARGEALMPIQRGSDEIARLDQVFHDMAAALEAASQKERAAAARIRSFIENMPVGLVTLNQDGIIDSVNPRTAQMFGYEPWELSGRHFVELFPEAAQSDPEGFMRDVYQKSLNRVSENKARKKTGELFPVELSLNEDGSGEGGLYLANILDVSERHEIERLKREFVAMVSHDLRTPLTSIQASMTLLSAGAFGELSKEATEVVTVAEQQIDRLRNLVNDLLDVAKIEAGKMDMHFANTDLNPLLQRSIDAVEALADEQQVDLMLTPSDSIVFADGERIIQVVVNLISNAIKYSPKGGVVNVASRAVQDWVEIRVQDEGPGISLEEQEAIFQKFEQVKDDSKKKSGTGLGLAISKTIVEQHGGTIGVESEPGKGSTFWFRIRAAQEESELTNRSQSLHLSNTNC